MLHSRAGGSKRRKTENQSTQKIDMAHHNGNSHILLANNGQNNPNSTLQTTTNLIYSSEIKNGVGQYNQFDGMMLDHHSTTGYSSSLGENVNYAILNKPMINSNPMASQMLLYGPSSNMDPQQQINSSSSPLLTPSNSQPMLHHHHNHNNQPPVHHHFHHNHIQQSQNPIECLYSMQNSYF